MSSTQIQTEKGNTKPSPQISPAKHWFFTWNNYTKENIESLKALDSSKVPFLRFQTEIGESGTPHLQGCLSFAVKSRPMGMLSQQVHWEKTKCQASAPAYCHKDETYDGTCRYNRGYILPPAPVKILSDDKLYPWQHDIIDIIKQPPDDRKIHWYWGDTNIGKTTFCKYLSHHYGAIPLSGKSSDMKNGVLQYKEKTGDLPTFVIIPLPKTYNLDYLSYEGIEQIKDMYFYSGKYEGGVVVGNSPHILIFANNPPADTSALAADRWVVSMIPSSGMRV